MFSLNSTNFANILEKVSNFFSISEKRKKKTLLESVQETKEQELKKIKNKKNQIRSDQEQLKNFEKEQEIQLMMNNTYNKKNPSEQKKKKISTTIFLLQ